MSERLTESERAILRVKVALAESDGADPVIAAVERMLTDRLAARGAGDGLAGRVAALAARYDLAAEELTTGVQGLVSNGKRAVYLRVRDDLRKLLDPGAQGADEGGGSSC